MHSTADANTTNAPASTGLPIGEVFDHPASEATLRPEKFNRHTFWCGQSGSGKSYALGVVLEQLLLRTGLPLLVLDPNADYVRLGRALPGIDAADAQRFAERDIRVLHSGAREGERLRTRFVDLSVSSKAAVLRLDPIEDAEEFNLLLHIEEVLDRTGRASFLETVRGSQLPGAAALALRAENLEVMEWELWSWGGSAASDVVDERPDATVLDLGGFAHREESQVAALGVLEYLWNERESRRPVLIVIDEAHNLCPPNPVTPLERRLVDQIVQIAAEGRKFGLWLLLSTQRPTKIHPNVLSQCDNLALMKMGAPRDLAELAELFGFVPGRLLEQAPAFVQGQALFAGGFIAEPTIVRMGARLSEEGGSDVRVPLRPADAGSPPA